MLAFHIDLNTVALKRDTILSLLRFVASCGYDAILWEVEDKICWDTCPECVHPEAFSKDEFREMLAEARKLGLSPIPLLQTFGHAEYVLSLPKYKHWRELPDKKDCYCVSRPEVRDFLKRWIHEYLDLFGDDVRYFHLGGDEAYSFGKCPSCSLRNRMELYAEHLKGLSAELIEKGIRPGCWCDMMLANGVDSAIDAIPKDFVIWHWNYTYGNPDAPQPSWGDKIGILKSLGYDIVFCGASQCGGEGPFLPRYKWHSRNLAAGARLVRDEALLGFCVTSWSIRGSLKALQYPLIEFAARCATEPGINEEVEFSNIVNTAFGGICPDLLFALTDWDHVVFGGLEGRSWNLYKDTSVPMAGQLEHVLSHMAATLPGFPGSSLKTAQALMARAESAAQAIEALPVKNELAVLLSRGAGLTLRLLSDMVSALKGERPPQAPVAASDAYFAIEQTEASAANYSRIIWAVLDESLAAPFDAAELFKPRCTI